MKETTKEQQLVVAIQEFGNDHPDWKDIVDALLRITEARIEDRRTIAQLRSDLALTRRHALGLQGIICDISNMLHNGNENDAQAEADSVLREPVLRQVGDQWGWAYLQETETGWRWKE